MLQLDVIGSNIVLRSENYDIMGFTAFNMDGQLLCSGLLHHCIPIYFLVASFYLSYLSYLFDLIFCCCKTTVSILGLSVGSPPGPGPQPPRLVVVVVLVS